VERKLQVPHGGELVNLMVEASEKENIASGCTKQLELSDRNACDVELLCVG
jgi:sulfate adenylyltransferase